jgi:hypothetical protein
VCPTGKKGKKDMGIAIIRVEKITNSGSATGKTEHNYRLKEVTNADPNKEHLNKEYINHNKENIWDICNKRIEDVGVVRVRKDAVRGMEFILTASPDVFSRDQNGVTNDFRNTKYVKANLDFLKNKYGDNLVAFTLHQDEKTPHIHAVVVPITDKGRLSAKEMFNPKTLKELQTEYAEAMKPFGLERGLEGSKATHLSMKQMYALHNSTEKSIEEDLEPPILDLKVDTPSRIELLNPLGWATQQNEILAEKGRLSMLQLQQYVQKAKSIALENTKAKRQADELKKDNIRLNRLISALEDKYHEQFLIDKKHLQEDLAIAQKRQSRSVEEHENFILDLISGKIDSDDLLDMAKEIINENGYDGDDETILNLLQKGRLKQ